MNSYRNLQYKEQPGIQPGQYNAQNSIQRYAQR